ncbi:MAG: hypothetical protein KGJ82_15690 [Nitrospirota bacterium]|nr:hypothetical protein [Nitrospirota bacterium]
MLKTLIFRLSLGIVLTSSSLAFSQTNDAIIYEFKGDIPPVKLTFSDLDKFLRDLQHLYSTVPENTENTCTYELAGPKGSISGSSIDKIFGEDRLLTYANEFRLGCFNRRLFVSSINITLGHLPRWEIKGTDRVLLESVKSHIEDFGDEHSTYLGGLTAQVIFLIVFGQIFYFSPQFLANRILPRETRIKYGQTIFLISLLLQIIVIAFLMIFAIPARLFPTVAIYRGTASVLERYSSDIGFWGLIISLGLAIFLWRWPVAIPSQKVEAPPSPSKGRGSKP